MVVILRLVYEPKNWGKDDPKRLWEENMHEPWADYSEADKFVIVDQGDIVGGFAVYRDDSDGIAGLYCSGWAARHRGVPTADILRRLADNVGDVYFKTDQRAAKILLGKIGKIVKKTDRFVYYIVRGKKNGKA